MFGRRAKAQPGAPEGAPESLPSQPRDEVPPGSVAVGRPALGPYDVDEAPDDGWIRLDLGSLRLPVPEGAELQVEVDSSGPVRAVHLLTGLGQFTLTAFAAPRSGGLWREVAPELVSRLRAEGARVGRVAGEWGEEIEAVTEQGGVLRFLAVDGSRWMLRGVAAGTAEHADDRSVLLRDVIRRTVVVRGPEPLPVRSPLPLRLPGPLGEQLKQATAGLS
ncbi:MAG: DUF3710 domain-containing protein [Pseudonocardiaceae bacterium]